MLGLGAPAFGNSYVGIFPATVDETSVPLSNGPPILAPPSGLTVSTATPAASSTFGIDPKYLMIGGAALLLVMAMGGRR